MLEKGYNLENVSYNDKDIIAPFAESFSLFLFKKTERIVLALYLVTDHLSEAESIRHSIRQQADNLLKDIVAVTAFGKSDADTSNLQTSAYMIEALLDLGVSMNLVAFNNGVLVKAELTKLIKDTSLHMHATPRQSDIKKSFFVVDVPKERKENVNKGHIGHNKKEMSFKKPAQEISYNIEDKGLGNFSEKTKDSSKRESDIMQIVRSKGQVTIKDITDVMTNIGSKTIQRTLLKMVQDGVLKKEGERRWSTYTIA